MQHSLFDRLYLTFLGVLLISFSVIIAYTSHATKNALVEEKSENLTNEAILIARQVGDEFLSDSYDRKEISDIFKYYSDTLNAQIWYVDNKGNILVTSDSSLLQGKPHNVYLHDNEYRLNENFSTVGTFYDIFDDNVITVNVPLYKYYTNNSNEVVNEEPVGALILHAKSNQINNLMINVLGLIFVPCLILIAISFAFLGIISKKVSSPIKKITHVANEYSEGNFDVKTGIKSNDEIGSLAKSLEYMADGLSKLEDYRKDFISNISHDFRSPLTSIKGYIGAILDGTIPYEKQERYLNIVLDETDRLTKLTSGLLDLNNLERFGPYLKLSDFDIVDIIKTSINSFEMKSTQKNVDIFLNNHSVNSVVTADKEKIKQVVYNLIDNALKFTPEGNKIFVTVMDRDEKVVVSIRDEGIGMDENTRKKVFVRFYKGDASRGKDKRGSGLGLAITKEIIKTHNESIDVTSEVGQGTEFKFTLPRANNTKIE